MQENRAWWSLNFKKFQKHCCKKKSWHWGWQMLGLYAITPQPSPWGLQSSFTRILDLTSGSSSLIWISRLDLARNSILQSGYRNINIKQISRGRLFYKGVRSPEPKPPPSPQKGKFDGHQSSQSVSISPNPSISRFLCYSRSKRSPFTEKSSLCLLLALSVPRLLVTGSPSKQKQSGRRRSNAAFTIATGT